MNAGELKKLLKDIPNHFEVIIETEGKELSLLSPDVLYGQNRGDRIMIRDGGMREKKSNVLVLREQQ